MATPEALDSLHQTTKALEEIKTQLRPFVRRLQQAEIEDQLRAQAQAAVALSIGTLRYMGARLRGLDQGRTPDDPLRQELNQMRRVLVAVQEAEKKKTKEDKKTTNEDGSKTPVSKEKAADKEKEESSSERKREKPKEPTQSAEEEPTPKGKKKRKSSDSTKDKGKKKRVR